MANGLEKLRGRVNCSLGYEYLPFSKYSDVFGAAGKRYFEVLEEQFKFWRTIYDGQPADTMEITFETAWTKKGPLAPSAGDITRRPAVLDAVGIRRQLVTPALIVHAIPVSTGHTLMQPAITPEGMMAASDLMDAYNEWVADLAKKYGDRFRLPGAIPTTNVTVDELVRRAEHVIRLGVRLLTISPRVPPCGVSPGDPALDAFYAALAEAKVPLILRGGSQGTGFRATEVWGKVPESVFGGEFPYWGKDIALVDNVHQAEEHFLTCMVLGGVFERHPTLRVGLLKVGAGWLGPMAERLDRGLPPFFKPTHLPLKPSEYLNRNVRVTPWADGGDGRKHYPFVKDSAEGGDSDEYEPVEVYFQRYPMIRNCYCYASDIPLDEGGKYNLQKWYQRVAPLGDDIVERYFVTNAEWLLPD
jgi:predicted TIM-barrel fold metal-dependent hydrolase